MLYRGWVPVAVLVMVAVAIGGCGGSSSGDSGSSTAAVTIKTSSLSKAQFLKQANTICAKVEPEIYNKSQAFSEKPSSAGLSEEELVAAMVEPVAIPTMQRAIDGVRKLGAPSGDEAQVEAFLVAMQEGNDRAKDAQITSFHQFGQEFTEAGRLARRYGLESCVFSPALR